MNPGAIKNAKKIYIGNLPLDANEDELRDFLNDALEKIGALNGPGLPVVSCKIVQVSPDPFPYPAVDLTCLFYHHAGQELRVCRATQC
jgi:hypothetical protein